MHYRTLDFRSEDKINNSSSPIFVSFNTETCLGLLCRILFSLQNDSEFAEEIIRIANHVKRNQVIFVKAPVMEKS